MTQTPRPEEGRYEEPGVPGTDYTTPSADPYREASYSSAPAGTEGVPTGPTAAGAFAAGRTTAEAGEYERHAAASAPTGYPDTRVGGETTVSGGYGATPTGEQPRPAATYDPAAGSGASAYSREGDPRSLGQIASDLLKDASTLVRQEVDLAKAELRESATRTGKGAGLLGGAGVAGHFALLFLSLALWWAIAVWIGSASAPALGWSGLIVGVIYAIVAGALLASGRSELKRVRGVPRTAETVSKIPNAVKGNEEMNR